MGKEFVVDSLEDMCALMCDNNTERLEERKMADIELVIKLDENVFTRLFDNGIEDYAIVNDDLFAIAKSIRNGTPLTDVFDKIMAEIDDARFIDKNTKICENALASGLEVAMEIIDKYKAESEEM